MGAARGSSLLHYGVCTLVARRLRGTLMALIVGVGGGTAPGAGAHHCVMR